jgi:similar to stage IV sporulation protein
MIIIQILRYIFGYINFRAYGGFSDRFLNLCTRYGIPLWNIKNVKGNISATTTVDGYLSIRRAVKKSGMKTIVLEKKGLKFFLRKNKIRVGILIGAVIFVCIIAILTRFVWSVSLVGNVNLEEEQLLSAFEKYGVKVGAPISALDEKETAKKVELIKSAFDQNMAFINDSELTSDDKYAALSYVTDKIAELVAEVIKA